jgi:hypothetical protein
LNEYHFRVEGKGILDRGMGVEGRDMVDEHVPKRSGGGGYGCGR